MYFTEFIIHDMLCKSVVPIVKHLFFSLYLNFAIFACRKSLHFDFADFPVECTNYMRCSRHTFLTPHCVQAELRHLQR